MGEERANAGEDRPFIRCAELLAARICHDLGGLVSTLQGVIGLAGEDQDAMALALESADRLSGRLQLLRAAWAGGAGALTLRGVLTLADGLPGRERLTIDAADLPADTEFSEPAARLVLNLLLLAAEGLPKGGRITLAGGQGGDMVAMLDGPRAAWPAGLPACIADDTAASAALGTPRSLQAPWMALLTRALGGRLSFLMAGGPDPAAPLVLTLPP